MLPPDLPRYNYQPGSQLKVWRRLQGRAFRWGGGGAAMLRGRTRHERPGVYARVSSQHRTPRARLTPLLMLCVMSERSRLRDLFGAGLPTLICMRC